MELQTAKKLSSSKEVKEFVVFVAHEMDKLNRNDDIDDTQSADDIKIEIKGRKFAYNKLKDILEPLIDMPKRSDNFNNQEYIA